MANNYTVPSTIRHAKAFRSWYAAGRVLTKGLAKELHRTQDTIYKWRDDEEWLAAADELDKREAEAIGDTFEAASAEAVTEAVSGVLLMLKNTTILNAAITAMMLPEQVTPAVDGETPSVEVKPAMPDDWTLSAVASYSSKAFEGAAKIFGWADKLKVEHSGAVETVTPEQMADITQRQEAYVRSKLEAEA